MLQRLALCAAPCLFGCAPAETASVAPPCPNLPAKASATEHRAWLGDFAAMQTLREQAGLEEDLARSADLLEQGSNHGQHVPSSSWLDLAYASARRYAGAGQSANAVRMARRLAEHGFRNHRGLQTDSVFSALQADPQFAEPFAEQVARVRDNDARYRQRYADPETAPLIFEDVPRFWEAFDHAAAATTRLKKAAIFRRDYLGRGTAGLIDYHWLKTERTELLLRQIDAAPGYYAGIREQTLRAADLEPKIRAGFRSLAKLYPDAHFPPTTFVVGRLNSGGTAGQEGMLVGLDLWSYTEGVPTEGVSPALLPILKTLRLENLPYIVLHEQIHAMQQYGGEDILLSDVLAEGSADFIAHLALPEQPQPPYYVWGLEHEDRVWARFASEAADGEYGDWLANYSGNLIEDDWHPDLGYFIGARICEAYYAQAADKTQAIEDLLFVVDPFAILDASGYADRFVGGGTNPPREP